jgi:hypothetical protein
MEGSDPCQLQADAVAESAADVARKLAALQAAMELSHQRMMMLMMCRMQNMPQ